MGKPESHPTLQPTIDLWQGTVALLLQGKTRSMDDDDDTPEPHDEPASRGTVHLPRLTQQQLAEQDETRNRLREYKRIHGLSDSDIATKITELKSSDIYKEYRSDRPLIGRFLINRFSRDNHTYIRSAKERILRKFLIHNGVHFADDMVPESSPIINNIFKEMSSFWDVTQNNIQQFRDLMITGTYIFYAMSEEYDEYIVIGAIKIEYDVNSGSITAAELQKDTLTSSSAERWHGYAFMRRSRVFLTMSADGFNTPKFYLLNPFFGVDVPAGAQRTSSVRTTRLHGIMTKLGKNSDIFVSGVHMVPDPDAFKKVQLIPLSSLPPDIPPHIIRYISGWGKK